MSARPASACDRRFLEPSARDSLIASIAAFVCICVVIHVSPSTPLAPSVPSPRAVSLWLAAVNDTADFVARAVSSRRHAVRQRHHGLLPRRALVPGAPFALSSRVTARNRARIDD